jgi:hypothetical protein
MLVVAIVNQLRKSLIMKFLNDTFVSPHPYQIELAISALGHIVDSLKGVKIKPVHNAATTPEAGTDPPLA